MDFNWKRIFLCILVALPFCLSELNAQSHLWLINGFDGSWEYQDSRGIRPIALGTAKYFDLRSEGQVRCTVKADTCKLYYLSEGTEVNGARTELTIPKLVKDKWVKLDTLDPPEHAALPPLEQVIALNKNPMGGSRSVSGCSGDFPLKAPMCGDTINLETFAILWRSSEKFAATSLAVRVDRVDGEKKTFRGKAVPASGKYADDDFIAFITSLQGRNNVVDVTITIEDGLRKAVRMVHIPPTVRTTEYRRKVREAESRDRLLTGIHLMSLALDEGMWTEAATQAEKLLEIAPDIPEVMEYALAGMCKSDFEDEKGSLASQLSRERSETICPPTAKSVTSAPAEADSQLNPATISTAVLPRKDRVGIALLIGNSAYWNVPLNSVKSDIQEMRKTLEAVGFDVTVRENLADPRQFQDAVLTFVKTKNATPDDVLLVYFSGHGLQIDGKAQILGVGVPTDARSIQDVRANAQNVEDLLAEMERMAPNTRLLIVDACRDNVFSSEAALGGQNPRAGFAFQQDDIPNTFVMFANRPGLPAPARSDYGLMGPFTESLVYALNNSSGDMKDVFALAQKKTAEMSPGQQPVLYASKKVDSIVLQQKGPKVHSNRSVELLKTAEPYYRQKDWKEFIPVLERARVLAEDPKLQQRLTDELEFAKLTASAEHEQNSQSWKEAATDWEKAHQLFPSRLWLAMNASVSYLMADNVNKAVPLLGELSASGDGQESKKAKEILAALIVEFPQYEVEIRKLLTLEPKAVMAEFELPE